MNKVNKTYHLIIEDLSNSISHDDKIMLNLWLAQSDENQKNYNSIKAIWEAESTDQNIEESWADFDKKIKQSNKVVQKLWIRAALVASVILLFASGWMVNLFSTAKLELVTNNQSFLKDTLDDGSQVFLYPSSSLVLNKSNNNVQLNGEAFFIIPPTQGNNYTIYLGDAVILVKGTSFRVNANTENDQISVRVESGSVELMSAHNITDKLIVSAGEEGFYSNETEVLWKNNTKENIYLIYDPNL